MKINIKKLGQCGFAHTEMAVVALVIVAVVGVGGFVLNKNNSSHAASGWTTLYPTAGGSLIPNINAIACTTSNSAILASMFFIIINHNSSARTIQVFDLDSSNNTKLDHSYSNYTNNILSFNQQWSPKKNWSVSLQVNTGSNALGGQFWDSFWASKNDTNNSNYLNRQNIALCPDGIN